MKTGGTSTYKVLFAVDFEGVGFAVDWEAGDGSSKQMREEEAKWKEETKDMAPDQLREYLLQKIDDSKAIEKMNDEQFLSHDLHDVMESFSKFVDQKPGLYLIETHCEFYESFNGESTEYDSEWVLDKEPIVLVTDFGKLLGREETIVGQK